MSLRQLFPMRAAGLVLAAAGLLAATSAARAEVKLPALFTDHMVLQRDQPNRVWGWAKEGDTVTVSIAGQKHESKADDQGRWEVKLEPLSAGGPHQLVVEGGNKLTIGDVLVGEVWICSGQSNMQFSVANSTDGDLEVKAAKFSRIRLITVPQVGTQEPQDDFKGAWSVCSPETVGDFSGVGFFFGRQIHKTLDVPVGLIDDSWGGSACEAWIPLARLQADPHYQTMLGNWEKMAKTYDHEKAMNNHKTQLARWQAAAKEARQAGKPAPQRPRPPVNQLTGNHRPANIYNGVLHPTIGYGIRGAIWYQGESNAGRAYEYRDLFPLMIQTWRDEWKQGDFPFYWVQLADFMAEKAEPAESTWAELREAQTMTMSRLPNTGQAVIVDLGEANDIHPRNKQEVGRRLARWALAKDYGVKVAYESPLYKSLEVQGGKAVVTLDHVGAGLRTFDVADVRGFAIAGADKKFVSAKAKILGSDKIEVSSDQVSEPVAVRYAWADNPICNLGTKEGLAVTPFRTDDWPGMTIGKTFGN
jgi:sialate O-acetylesterase